MKDFMPTEEQLIFINSMKVKYKPRTEFQMLFGASNESGRYFVSVFRNIEVLSRKERELYSTSLANVATESQSQIEEFIKNYADLRESV